MSVEVCLSSDIYDDCDIYDCDGNGKSLLGLDVIAFDANYNRLDTSETTTTRLFEELKKNSSRKTTTVLPQLLNQTSVASVAMLLDDQHIGDGHLVS